MVAAVKVKVNGSVKKWTDELEEKIEEGTSKTMLQAAEVASSAVRVEIEQGGSFRNPTGKLSRSYTATLLAPKGGKLRSGALSDSPYARIHDVGGTITPKSAKALTVPISPEAKRVSAAGLGARSFPTPLDLIWPKGKPHGFLIENQGKKSVFHYVLTGSVRIDGKHYLDQAAKKADAQIEELFDGALDASAGEADTK